MKFDLPPSPPVENIFVGYVIPNQQNEDPTRFFETLVEEMEQEQKKVQEPNNKKKSFQEIFESVNEKLKGKAAIYKIDKCGQNPIYLFNANDEDKGNIRFFFFFIRFDNSMRQGNANFIHSFNVEQMCTDLGVASQLFKFLII